MNRGVAWNSPVPGGGPLFGPGSVVGWPGGIISPILFRTAGQDPRMARNEILDRLKLARRHGLQISL